VRKPNLRFLLTFSGVCAILIVGAHFVHGFQARRVSSVLLLKARQHRGQSHFVEAANYYARYLAILPEDTDALGEYGLTLAKLPSARSQAIAKLEQVLRRNPRYPDARRALVQTAVAAGQFSIARAHLEEHLLNEKADDAQLKDGELWELKGVCQAADHEYENAKTSFKDACSIKPDNLQAYLRLAFLEREHFKDADAADGAVNLMIANNPQSAEAYHLRARYWRDYNELNSALADAAKSVELDGQKFDYVLFAAIAAGDASTEARVAGDTQQADAYAAQSQQYAAQAQEISPHQPQLYLTLADLALKDSSEKAAVLLEKGLSEAGDQPELLWRLANLRLDRGERIAAEKAAAQLRKVAKDEILNLYLDGRFLFHDGDVRAATSCFHEVQSKLANRRDLQAALQKQVDFWLGACYERTGQLDYRIEAYNRAVKGDPSSNSSRFGLAMALADADQIKSAIGEYQELVERSRPKRTGAQPADPRYRLYLEELTRLLFIDQLRQPLEKRDWQLVKERLLKAEEDDVVSPGMVVVHAQLLVAQGQPDKAAEDLAKASEQDPSAVSIWVARAALESQRQHLEEALAILNEAHSKVGDKGELLRERIRIAMQSKLPREVALLQLADLSGGWQRYSKDERFDLNREIAAAYARLGDHDKAAYFWSEANGLRPECVPGYLYRFDLAIGQKNVPSLDDLLTDISQIEGREQGPLWCYGEAARQVVLADLPGTPGDMRPAHIATARALLQQAFAQRPNWPRVYTVLGELDQRDGNLSSAIDQFEKALELGERNPTLVRSLVKLLYDQRPFAQAAAESDRILKQLDEGSPFSADLSRLASEVKYSVQDYDEALRLAKSAAENPRDVTDFLWLAQLQLLMDKPEDAERTYLLATQQMPDEPRSWLGLIRYWVLQNAREKIDEVLIDAAKHLPAEQIALARATAMESLAQNGAADTADCMRTAEAEFRRALQLNPASSVVLSRAGEFFLRTGHAAEAEKAFDDLLKPEIQCTEEDRATARRQLALILAGTRQYPKLFKAQSYVEINLKTGATDDDLREKALILSLLPGHQSRVDSIRILEPLTQRGRAAPQARALLAQVYEADGQWQPALKLRESLIAAAESDKDKAAAIAAYIRGSLAADVAKRAFRVGDSDARSHELADIQIWLSQLESLKADDLTAFELKVQFDVAEGRVAEALAAVRKRAGQLPTAGSAWAAQLLAGLTQKYQQISSNSSWTEATCQFYRDACAADPKLRSSAVSFLAAHGRTDEALAMCWDWAKEAPSGPALVAAASVVSGSAVSDADRSRVEDAIRQELRKEPKAQLLATALGSLLESQLRFTEAIEAYRQAIDANAGEAIALNNLALLLALSGKDSTHDATNSGGPLDLIKQAIDLVGPAAALLDTRGSIELRSGSLESAETDFSAAAADQPTATRWFHVALARSKLQKLAEARQAFQQALTLGLTPEQIHSLERKQYAQLVSDLK
jgi:tetratricopeptide (TPR) repeat protein